MRKGIQAILFVLILAISHAAQVKPVTTVDVIPDVVYGHKDGLALTFDVFKPKTNPNGAAVIFIVSGGWVSRYTPAERQSRRQQARLQAMVGKPPSQAQLTYLQALGDASPPPANMAEASARIDTLKHGRVA